MSDISEKKRRADLKPELEGLTLTEDELDRVFGGMTGTFVCAGKQQSVVLK